jgi:hypothetical protein
MKVFGPLRHLWMQVLVAIAIGVGVGIYLHNPVGAPPWPVKST